MNSLAAARTSLRNSRMLVATAVAAIFVIMPPFLLAAPKKPDDDKDGDRRPPTMRRDQPPAPRPASPTPPPAPKFTPATPPPARSITTTPAPVRSSVPARVSGGPDAPSKNKDLRSIERRPTFTPPPVTTPKTVTTRTETPKPGDIKRMPVGPIVSPAGPKPGDIKRMPVGPIVSPAGPRPGDIKRMPVGPIVSPAGPKPGDIKRTPIGLMDSPTGPKLGGSGTADADRLRKRTVDTKTPPPSPPVVVRKPEVEKPAPKHRDPKDLDLRGADVAPPSSRTSKPEMSDVRKRLLDQDRSGPGVPPGGAPKSDARKVPEHPFVPRTVTPGKIMPLPTRTPGMAKPHVTPRARVDDLPNIRFADRVKSGQLDKVTGGQVAQKLQLSEQYKMLQQGDVARRLKLQERPGAIAGGAAVNHPMNINKNAPSVAKILGPDHHYYHGVVSPTFSNHCFKYRYWGPNYFAGNWWYPHWSPWVNWCWHPHWHPLWDPRPIWCRPVMYGPCPVWVYYPVPVWTPLPVAACGTWVDVKPVAVAQGYDLQLLAVRFVDPGHPEEKLGPRYRVWFRNNSEQPVTQPFNVVLLASNDDKPRAGLPQAGVRVTAIEANDTQSVDVRLPMDVFSMGRDAQGNPAPFGTLHALVDANKEVPQADRTNDGARVPRADILPVDPVAFAADPTQAAAGGEVVLAGEGFGPQPGQVLVHLGGLEMEGEILGWYDLGVRLSLPKVPLTTPTSAELIVVRGDGAAANPVKITVTAPQQQPEAP